MTSTMAGPGPEPQPGTATVLRDLAWTIHRLLPARAGLEPLPLTELAVLKRVLDAPGSSVSELAQHLGLQQSNTSAAVRALVERGLLVRERSTADARITRVVPTDQALEERRAVDGAWSGAIGAALGRLTPGQAAALEAAVDALRTLDRLLRAAPG